MSVERLAVAEHWLAVDQPQRALEALDGSGEAALTPEGLRIRARALVVLEDYTTAQDVAARALALTPDDPDTLAILADARLALGDLVGAEVALLSALKVDTEDVYLLAAYARVLATAGVPDKAEQVLGRAARLEPNAPIVHQTRSYLALARGDDKAAREHARAALAAAPDDTNSHALYGASSALLGQTDAADRHLSTVAASQLGDRDARELALEARISAHPLLYPLRIIGRTSPAAVWLVGVGLLVLAAQLLPDGPRSVVFAAWLSFVVWSWVGPPLVRAWVTWRAGW